MIIVRYDNISPKNINQIPQIMILSTMMMIYPNNSLHFDRTLHFIHFNPLVCPWSRSYPQILGGLRMRQPICQPLIGPHPRNTGGSSKRPEAVSEVRSRPAPAALQEVVDRPSVGRGQRPREPATGNQKSSDWSMMIISKKN